MSRPFIILAAGGHAKVVADLLKQCSHTVLGMAEKDREEWVFTHPAREVSLANGLGSVSNNQARAQLFLRMTERGYDFPSLVHPSAIVSPDVEIGAGSQIMAGAIVQPGARIGRNVIVNTGAIIEHDCVIGDHVHVASGARLSGSATLGESAFIGAGATVIQSVKIGKNAVIGAGAVVIDDISENTQAVGVPARGKSI